MGKHEFKAYASGDYESFCLDVDRKTFCEIRKEEPRKMDESYFNADTYRIYPDDLFRGTEEELLKIKVEIEPAKEVKGSCIGCDGGFGDNTLEFKNKGYSYCPYCGSKL